MLRKVFVLLFTVIIISLLPLLFFFQNKPLLPKQYAVECPYYKDLLGRFFMKWSTGSLMVTTSKVTIWHNKKDINVKNFKILEKKGGCFATDGKQLLNSIFTMKDADSSSWEYVGGKYSKDINFVYYGAEKFNGPDPEHFSFLNPTDCKDNSYYSYHYSKDLKNVWYQRIGIKGADPNTFEIYCENNQLLGKDKNSLYRDGAPTF